MSEAAAVMEDDLRLDALGRRLLLDGLEGPASAPCPISLSSEASSGESDSPFPLNEDAPALGISLAAGMTNGGR